MSRTLIPGSDAQQGNPESSPQSPGSVHPLPIGGRVTIIGVKGGLPFIEGHAVISAPARGEHRYFVTFVGDRFVRERFVHAAYQLDPDAALAWMIEFLRAASEPPRHEEFFPDNTTREVSHDDA